MEARKVVLPQNRTLEGPGLVILWYHLGTIPVPCPHHTNSVPIWGVQHSRQQAWNARFKTKRFRLTYRRVEGWLTWSAIPAQNWMPGRRKQGSSCGGYLGGESSQCFQDRLARTPRITGELSEQRQRLLPTGRKRRQEGIVERHRLWESVLEGKRATQWWHRVEQGRARFLG